MGGLFTVSANSDEAEVPLGEMALGISLFLGLLVQLSTFVGMLAVLNFHFTTGALLSISFLENPSAILLVASLLVLFLARAGRTFGVNALLAKGKPKSMLY